MSIVWHLAAVAAPWASFYNDSTVTQTLIAFGHFGGMMVAGGSAVTADRGVLQACGQAGSGRLRRIDDISGAHRAVVVALAVTSISGVLMLAADLENLARSPWFWLKMSLLLLLIINGWFMTRISRASAARRWRYAEALEQTPALGDGESRPVVCRVTCRHPAQHRMSDFASSWCDGCPPEGRRDFLKDSLATVAAALMTIAAAPLDALAIPIRAGAAIRIWGNERSYPVPPADGAVIDKDNEVILVRYAGARVRLRALLPAPEYRAPLAG